MGDIFVGDKDLRSGEPKSGVEVPENTNDSSSLRAECLNFIGDCSFLRRVENFFVVPDTEVAAEVAAIIASTFNRNDSSLSVRRNTRNLSLDSSSPSSISVGSVDCEEYVAAVDVEAIEDSRSEFDNAWIGVAVWESNSI
jgi:hypothetical protein